MLYCDVTLQNGTFKLYLIYNISNLQYGGGILQGMQYAGRFKIIFKKSVRNVLYTGTDDVLVRFVCHGLMSLRPTV